MHNKALLYDNCNCATVKYDANGRRAWVARYIGTTNTLSRATALATDGAGNVYVTGWSQGAGGYAEYITVKYDPNGRQLWAVQYRDPAFGDAVAVGIAVDASDNVYVTGDSHRSDGAFVAAVTLKYVQVPEFTTVAVQPSGQFAFTVVGEAGRSYTIQASTDLVHWIALTNFVSATGTNQFADAAAPNFNRRFYRVITP